MTWFIPPALLTDEDKTSRGSARWISPPEAAFPPAYKRLRCRSRGARRSQHFVEKLTVRGCCGWGQHLPGVALFDDLPVDHKSPPIRRFARKADFMRDHHQRDAQIRQPLITSSTSPTSSGSSAEVGSSNRITFGFSASARAMAMRVVVGRRRGWRG